MVTVKSRACAACQKPIPAARLAAVPDTSWCVGCAESRVHRVGGNMVWDHKTAPTLEVKSAGQAKAFARATRRHAFNASLSLTSMSRAMNDRDGIKPFQNE